ncbi:MAG: FMN-binding negative transcriptional regulator [Alphaproteobacteria bacterium]
MYIPPAFREDDTAVLHAEMRAARVAHFVTATAEGMIASPIPMFVEPSEGPYGTLYGHVARANAQWKTAPIGEAVALFMGVNAYVTPSWYQTKRETGMVVPTWNYVAVHAYGTAEFFEDADRLLGVVTRLTNMHEESRAAPWAVTDAPDSFIRSQLRGIVGVRMPIARLEGKRKMSQNRNEADRAGVKAGLAASDSASDRAVAPHIPK